MGKLELSEIKQILQNASNEIMIVHKEAVHMHGNVSDIKVEKLKKLLGESEEALTELNGIHVSLTPKLESGQVQNLMDAILKVRKDPINPSVLQAVLSSLQKLNMNLDEVRIDKDDRLGKKIEGVNKSKGS